MERTLNRNSWHFKAAKWLDVLEFDFNWDTEEYDKLRPISVCAYVRGLTFKLLLAAIFVFFMTMFGIGAVVFPIAYVFTNAKDLPAILQLFFLIGEVTWLSLLVATGILLIFEVTKRAKEHYRIYKWNKPEKVEKEEGFVFLAKTVYKDKICFNLK